MVFISCCLLLPGNEVRLMVIIGQIWPKYADKDVGIVVGRPSHKNSRLTFNASQKLLPSTILGYRPAINLWMCSQQFLDISQQFLDISQQFWMFCQQFWMFCQQFWMFCQQFLDVQSTISVNNLLASSNLTARDNCTKHGYLSSTIHDYLILMGWHVYVLNYVGD